MSARRLRHGEWIAGAGGAVLLLSLFTSWYGFRARAETLTGWQAFSVLDLVLALLVLLALALAVLQATRTTPAAPVGAAVLTATFGGLCALLVLYRIVDQPGPNEFVDVRAGAWLGLAAAVAVAAGGWLAMRDERVPGAPPAPEPELRPTPAP